MAENAKIVRLTAENVKRLKAVEITPDGAPVVVVSGRNGQGKSSVLDAIWMALGGAEALPRRPVRDGAESGLITIELDSILIRRRIKPDGSTRLVVTTKDGAEYRSPQALLDGLVGALSFDPLDFARMPPKARLELLRKLVGLDVSDLERRRAVAYEERTTVGREVRRLEGEISGVSHHPDAPATEVSVAELAAELRAAEEHSRRIERAEADVERAAGNLQRARDQAQELRDQIAQLEQQLAELRERLYRGDVDVIPTRERALEDARALVTELSQSAPDRDLIAARLTRAEATNAAVRDNRRREQLKSKHADAAARVAELTAEIERVDREKRERLAAAPWPVPELGMDEDGVLLAGVPFEQASSAEQLRASVAIGLALNPKLRVLLVRDGSLLDEDSLRLLSELAAEHDAQVWLEAVGRRDGVGVVIEDGAVAGAPPTGVSDARA